MRAQKKRLEEKYGERDLEAVAEEIHREVESSPVWKKFLKKHRAAV